jgi:hypothetical protein
LQDINLNFDGDSKGYFQSIDSVRFCAGGDEGEWLKKFEDGSQMM